MPRGQGGTLSGFTPLSTPNAPTGLSVSAGIGSATVSFTAPTDTGDGAVTSYIVTAVNESTGVSVGAVGAGSPITVSPGGGTFKIRAQAVNAFGPGRLTEFDTGNAIFSGAALYSWGNAQFGRLALTASTYSPTQVGTLTNWAKVSAGHNFGGAVKTDGTLWTWGQGSIGKLGNNTTNDVDSPVQIGTLTNWAQVATGAYHTRAITTNGELYAWGSNGQGRLGDGTTFARSSPVQIGALTNWAYAADGQPTSALNFTVAIKTDGTLWSWGSNQTGRLGIGVYGGDRSSPVQIGALTNWSQASIGDAEAAAIKTDGTLWAWGNNNGGRLGDNTTFARSSPVQIGTLTNWAQVSVAGSTGMHAVKTDGTLWAWGSNASGRIGDNVAGTNVGYRSSPVQIGALTNWAQVCSAPSNGFAVKTDGTLWSWGANNFGQLGIGSPNSTFRSSPVQVGSLTDWSAVSGTGLGNHALLGVL